MPGYCHWDLRQSEGLQGKLYPGKYLPGLGRVSAILGQHLRCQAYLR